MILPTYKTYTAVICYQLEYKIKSAWLKDYFDRVNQANFASL